MIYSSTTSKSILTRISYRIKIKNGDLNQVYNREAWKNLVLAAKGLNGL
jgi:hypothetical protein